MKKLTALVVLSLLLTSCGGNERKELSPEKASKMAKEIDEETANIEAVEVTIQTTTYKSKDAEPSIADLYYKKNKNGEFYTSTTTAGRKAEYYLVTSEKYEKVLFYHVEEEGKEDTYSVTVKKNNNNAFDITLERMGPDANALGIYQSYWKPNSCFLESPFDAEYSKCYSSGDNDLLVQVRWPDVSTTYSFKSDESHVTVLNIDAEYENKRFKCSDEVVEYSDGQKYLTKCSATYPDSCFIALPNGWEEHLNK